MTSRRRDRRRSDEETRRRGARGGPRPSVLPVPVDRPVQTVGRRKEAVVRIRLLPGTGTFTLNGRTMDSYFPNKVHQQLIKEPLVTWRRARSTTSSPGCTAAA